MTLGLDLKLFQDHKPLMHAIKYNFKNIFKFKIMLLHVDID